MSTNTSHYNLEKQGLDEHWSVDVLNSNLEKIDAALWNLPATYKRSLTTSDDLDSILDGVYYLSNSLPSGVPSEAQFCFFFQVSNSTIKHQYIVRPFIGTIWVREHSGNPSAWQAWKAIGKSDSGTISTGIAYKRNGNVVTIFINNVSVSASGGWSSLATLPSGYGSPNSVHVKSIDGTDLRVSGTSLDYRGSASSIYGTITYVI